MEYLLDKSRSRQRIEIICDAKDDWFLNVNWVEKKTSKITHTSCIIRKDLEGWVKYLQSTMGGNWIIKEKYDRA
jgi:hypothetical protein